MTVTRRRIVGQNEVFQQGKTYELVLEVSGVPRTFKREEIQAHLRNQLEAPTLEVIDYAQGPTTRVAFTIPSRADLASLAREQNQGVDLGEIQALVIPVLVWQIGVAIVGALALLLILAKVKEIVELIFESTPPAAKEVTAWGFSIGAVAALLGVGWLWWRSFRP